MGVKLGLLTLREEHRLRVFENRVLRGIFGPRRLRVFENRVLRGIFGPRRDERTTGWRKLHNEELRDLYPSSSIIRIIKLRVIWAGHVARMWEKRNACKLMVGRVRTRGAVTERKGSCPYG
jgi:hypothetical protein